MGDGINAKSQTGNDGEPGLGKSAGKGPAGHEAVFGGMAGTDDRDGGQIQAGTGASQVKFLRRVVEIQESRRIADIALLDFGYFENIGLSALRGDIIRSRIFSDAWVIISLSSFFSSTENCDNT